MTHPAIYAVGLGVAIGIAIFAYFATSNPSFHHRYDSPPPRRHQYNYSSRGSSTNNNRNGGAEVCTICLEPIDECHKKQLHCGHSFHKECERRLRASATKICPNCRAEFE